MKIPKELTPSIFKISKKVFEKNLTFKEGQQILVGDYKMNPNSAADYINNFRCMIEGIRFTRTIKQEDMNLQLFDLDFEPKFEAKDTYEVPDRISFGDPGRLFDEN